MNERVRDAAQAMNRIALEAVTERKHELPKLDTIEQLWALREWARLLQQVGDTTEQLIKASV